MDKSIRESGKLISLNIEDSKFSYYSETEGFKEQFKLKILGGNHYATFYLINPTEPAYKRTNFAYQHFRFKVLPASKGIRFFLKEKEIVFELFE